MKTILRNYTNNYITLQTGHKLGVWTKIETVMPIDGDLQDKEVIDGRGLILKTDSLMKS